MLLSVAHLWQLSGLPASPSTGWETGQGSLGWMSCPGLPTLSEWHTACPGRSWRLFLVQAKQRLLA